MNDPGPYLFLHIPKTAGTSFRLAVERTFDGRVIYDYGAKTPATSELVREHVYAHPDLPTFKRRLVEQKTLLFGGHVPYERYASIFAPDRVITFLREPIARVVSQHRHARRLQGYEGSLLDFAAERGHQNLQTAMLRGVSLHDAAFVGITECYGDSLALLAERLGLVVPELKANRDPARAENSGLPSLSVSEEAAVREHNQLDLQLYADAHQLLQERLTPITAPAPEPGERARPRGVLGRYREGTLIGWAQFIGNHEPVRVRVQIDGAHQLTVVADRWRADLREKGLHPTGRAGFVAEVGQLPPGTEVRCFFEGTDLELAGSPLIVS